MSKEYNPKEIEQKWQGFWSENKCFHAKDDFTKKKYYALVEFPYPSGQGLHVGHPRPYTALDIVSRKRRMQGYNVLYPMGFDAFGLPAENYAIKNKVHPAKITEKNIEHFTEQLKSLGFSFDWDRVIRTIDPDYYRWTQWIFIQLYKNGLAYKKEFPINWCPSCKVGLSNEEVVGGHCERCGSSVEHRVKNQWMLKITEYADRLIDDLKEVDFLPKIKQQQTNWIGRSYGCEVLFGLKDSDGNELGESIKIYTTRPDTMFGATYMVIAPEHPILKDNPKIKNIEDIEDYQKKALLKSDFERGELAKEKSGVMIDGIKAINPATNKEIPIWVSDYVLMSYGTGAIMAVPAHDTRDWEFAKKFDMPIIEVVNSNGKVDINEEAYTDTATGKMINSGFLNGLSVKEATEKISLWLEENGFGNKKKNFKLRDWVFSRQRYWGEPIPMIWCDEHGWVPVPEDQLPVLLPDVENYEPTDDGESPLSAIDSFVNTTCPICGKPAKRETDTMPQWAGSSWYYLRYMDSNNDKEPVSKEKEQYFGPVDWYNGGMEHTTLHLLYSRFWHKFLYDIGVVSTKEPYNKRTSHGMILGTNGEKMSKSRGNVVNPDDIINDYGADTLRTYESFIGDFEKDAAWSNQGVQGCRRFLERVWNLKEILVDGDLYSEDMEILMNQTIKKVSEDYETLKYNTAVAQMMSVLNEFRSKGSVNRKEFETFLILLNPVAPHITEELWEETGFEGHIATDGEWPEWDETKLKDDMVEMPIQINGKVRATVALPRDVSKEEAVEIAKNNESIMKHMEGKTIRKVIYVPERILNIVVG